MPIKVVRPLQAPDVEKYVAALVEELKENNVEEAQADSPLIVEQYLPRTDRLYVTTIWDGWSNVDRESRGGIILEAYKRVRGPEFMLRISIAMGLTRQDARNIGIDPDTGIEIGNAA